MSLDNGTVILSQGQPATMRFSAFKELSRQRKDPDSGFVSDMKVMSFQVIELNGLQITAIYDVTSEKLMNQLRPYLDPATLALHKFTITKTGTGYGTQYTLQVN